MSPSLAIDEGAELDALAPVGTGKANMAWDRERLRAASQGDGGACFRLYRWSPGCITLGRGQALLELPEEILEAHGLDVVTRPTGGRALLHAEGDLTYSVILPRSHPVAGLPLVTSYEVISGCVLRALRAVGAASELAREPEKGSAPMVPGACFEEHQVETLLLEGRKVCGSSQARKRGAILQHGAIPMRIDYELQARLFHPGLPLEEGVARLRSRACGLLDVLPPGRGDASIRLALVRFLQEELRALVEGGPVDVG